MTSQFLTKFAPHDQRVYMPTNEVFLNSGIEVNGERWYGDSVVQVVPELIFNRTRFLFIILNRHRVLLFLVICENCVSLFRCYGQWLHIMVKNRKQTRRRSKITYSGLGYKTI